MKRGKPKNIQNWNYGYAKNNEFMQTWKIILTELYQDMFKNEKIKLRKEFLDNYWHSKDAHNQSGSLLHAPIPPQCTDLDSNNFPRECKGGPYKRNHSPPKNNNNTYKRSKFNSEVSLTETITKQPEDKTRIIPVLRYISVLETHLGSLGSKILSLLSSALSLDKSEDITNILLNRKENYVLLETAKERLTGLLEANILDKSLISVTDNAIRKIDSLLLPLDKTKFSTNMLFSSDRLQLNNRRDSKEYLKITEISNFIEKHEKLSHLTFSQKTAITQQIGSVLIIQNKLEISDEDLVLLINHTVKQLNLPSKEENSLFQGYNQLKNSNQMDRYDSHRGYPSNHSASYSDSSRNHQNYRPKSNNFFHVNNIKSSLSSASKSVSNDILQSVMTLPFKNDFKSSYVPGHIPGYVPGYMPGYVHDYTPSQGNGHTTPYRQSFSRNHYTNKKDFRNLTFN